MQILSSTDVSFSSRYLSWWGYEKFLRYTHSVQSLILGTLGPQGTSSEYALNHFANNFLAKSMLVKTQLFNTFEDLGDALSNHHVQLAIVPHAYEKINFLYMNKNIDLVFIFVCPTPEYVLVKRKNTPVILNQGKLATHPAPLPILQYLLPKDNHLKDLEIKLVNSTSVAARMVNDGIVNLAITNEISAEQYDLEIVANYGTIPMSWSIFQQKS